jgi:hypothetical protein
MKVKVEVVGTVRYMGELTMTKKEYKAWCDRVDGAHGLERDRVANDLIEKFGLQLADPSDWGELEVDTFESQ